ncbi:N-6 DNA methylase [Methylobacterium brachiatum]|uniref:N-6 DNA methylase n=1 Tax=Methylobacterium brachiatum TaxID=269660 RepID=UPI0008E7145E|nr:N-6 DNA methylase [Methylobacterium brachiatum]SFJ68531.1 Methyltransferase domain-containing protein [Methylobacterium brachiatum]
MRVSQDVLAVLDRASCEGNALSLVALGKLDRKLYADINKALEAAGGKWNRKAQAHLFEGDAAEAIEPIILTGEIVSVRQELQQFDTPPDLAARVVAEARISPDMSVLEPSAGLGALVRAAVAAGGNVHCIELDAKRADGLALDVGDIIDVLHADFLACEPGAVHDRVVMNPPFTKGQDIAHVEHAMRFLKPGGRLVAIMSGGILYRAGKQAAFRQRIMDLGGTIAQLPADSFKASGTNVSTCLVSLNMPEGEA